MAIPSLRKSNISNFVPMMSNDEVIKQLLSPPNTANSQTPNELMSKIFSQENITKIIDLDPANFNNEETQSVLNNIVSSILVSTFHSLSIDINFTKEVLDFICSEVYKEINTYSEQLKIQSDDIVKKLQLIIIDQIGEYVKVVHEDYNICLEKDAEGNPVRQTKLSDTNFCINKEFVVEDYIVKRQIKRKGKKVKTISVPYFKHKNQFGILGHVEDKTKKFKTSDKIKFPSSPIARNRDFIFNTSEIVNYKLKKVNDQSDADIGQYLNKVDKDGNLKLRDEKDGECCSLSFIMMNNPKMRVGTKNSLELSTFLNSLSTIELSKCLPYLDVKFILPSNIRTKSDKIFQTSSITQFLDGTPITRSDNLTTPFYKTLSANFVRGAEGERQQRAVETNLSAFTMPQTINNFDELYVGHASSYAKGEKGNTPNHILFNRNNPVHDYTKPYLTIKSFNIDVAPTQGLMSFKTGRLSIILHDKARMSEVAPFIKPDLFGSFGAEIAIEYGWSHMDAIKDPGTNEKVNYFAQFLNENRVYEKYIITNSSYTIDKNGQVNIDLAIAMKGPVSIRAINFESNMPRKIEETYLNGLKTRLEDKKDDINDYISNRSNEGAKLNRFVGMIGLQVNIDKIEAEFQSNLDVTRNSKKMDATKDINTKYKKNKSLIDGATGVKKLQAIGRFFESLKRKVTIRLETPAAGTKKLSELTADNFKDPSLQSYVDEIFLLYARFVRLSRNASFKITGERKKQSEEIEGLLQKITDGLSIEDPFFDLENFSNVEQITNSDIVTLKSKASKSFQSYGTSNNILKGLKKDNIEYVTSIIGIDADESSANKSLTDYVSLGNIILAVLGSHLSFTGSYNEIQIVSYTLNEHAGLAMNKNVASLLINKSELFSFLSDLFKNGAQYTLESLLTQIVKKFITTRYCINYGMKDFYKLNENNQVELKDDSKKPDEIKKEIDKRLEAIHKILYQEADNESFLQEIKFVMPKIKLLFDTVTTKKSGGTDTILRISLFDRNDNPFNSISGIMNKVYEKGIHEAVRDINKRLIELKALKKKDKNYSNHKKKFFEENRQLIKKLEDADFLKKENGIYVINTKGTQNFTTIKEQLKSFMPSVLYGSNNSGIIDASISTINEAKLNTVYMTRPGRNDNKVKTRVRYKQDLPLRILPSQANVTMFGCPFVNFAQYIFLDFETGTTIDNQYAVTGIKHEITPGKFTTSLTLAYGDAYGKYETVVDTLSRTVNEKFVNERVPSDQALQETYKFDDDNEKSNMKLLEINQINKVLDTVTVHNIVPNTQINSVLLDQFGINLQTPEIEIPVELGISKIIKKNNINVFIREIKFINIEEKYQAFYEIKTDKELKVIDFKKLIIALPDDLKKREKNYYIDLRQKVLKKPQQTLPYLNLLDDDKVTKNFATCLANANTNSSIKDLNIYFESFIKQNKDFFDLLIEMYFLPLLKITIKEVDEYTALTLNDTLLFDLVSYNDLDSTIKEKINDLYSSNLNSKFNKDAISHVKKSSKRPRSKGYNLNIAAKDFTLTQDKVKLTVNVSIGKSKRVKVHTLDLSSGVIKSIQDGIFDGLEINLN